jgi:hypothetical protein
MSSGNQYTTQQIIEALDKAHGGIFVAAEQIGCSYKTIERRAKDTLSVKETIDKYRGRRSDIAQMKLESAILNGEPWSIQFQLKTQGKDRGFVERIEHTGKDDEPITLKVVRDE